MITVLLISPAIFSLFIFSRRWKIGEDGLIVHKQGKNVLEFVAIKSRLDSLEWAIPGVRTVNIEYFFILFILF